MTLLSLDDLAVYQLGNEIAISRWFEIDQKRINAFADLTEDHQFIHVDPARAAAETIFGGTIAHGYLTISLLSAMMQDALPFANETGRRLNLGFDTLRLRAPVPSGGRIRGRFSLKNIHPTNDHTTITWNVNVDLDGGNKNMLRADWLIQYHRPSSP